MTAREYFGEWEASGHEPVDGRLRIAVDGRITLELRKSLPEESTIRGHLSNGTPATLFGPALLRLDPNAEHYVQELVIGAALIGLDLPVHNEPVLTAASARIGGLAEVIGSSGLSLETGDITSSSNPYAKVEWHPTGPIGAALPNGTLTLVDNVRFEHESYFRFALEHRALARFLPAELATLEQVEVVFDVLTGFLAFATEARIGLGSIDLTASRQDAAEYLAHRRPRYGLGLKEVEPWLTLDTLSDPATALSGFFRFHVNQPAAYLILFEYLVFAAQLNPIDKLLYLARFLEVYHRTRNPGQRDPEDIHRTRVSLVKEALGDEHKAWVAQLLHHSNEITFKARVVDLLGGPAATAEPILGASPGEFAKVLGDCRNYWTHYSPDLESKALRDIQLDEFDDRLLLVVRACVLDDIGVPPQEAQRCLEADWRWGRRSRSSLERPV